MAEIVTDKCLLCNEPLNLRLTMRMIISFTELDWPVLCNGCQAKFVVLEASGVQCSACERQLDNESTDAYKQAFEQEGLVYCFDCLHWLETVPVSLMKHRALFDYNDALKDWISRYKYHGDIRLAHVMKSALKSAYKQYKDYRWIILPSSIMSLTQRRFHPVAYILDLAKISYTIPFDYIGDGVKQAHKTKSERLKLKKSFQMNDQVATLVGKDVLVFDDVYTTGATMIQAKKLISTVDNVGEIISLSIGRDQLNH
ncbi:ComF family protein [Aerococcaceae bacterium WGS1372]